MGSEPKLAVGTVESERVRTDLEKSLNLTLVLEYSWNLKKVPFVLDFVKLSSKI